MRTLALLALPLLLPAQEVSAQREAALGAGLAAENMRRMTVVDNQAVDNYLAGLATRLRAELPAETPEFRIAVVANEPDGPMSAPVALPGGYLFVPARMIVEAVDEAAFVRLFVHAIAHVAGRHGFLSGPGAQTWIFVNGIDSYHALAPRAWMPQREQWETEANARVEKLMESFRPEANFAAVQAELRSLNPPRKPPSLRRAGEPRPQ